MYRTISIFLRKEYLAQHSGVSRNSFSKSFVKYLRMTLWNLAAGTFLRISIFTDMNFSETFQTVSLGLLL